MNSRQPLPPIRRSLVPLAVLALGVGLALPSGWAQSPVPSRPGSAGAEQEAPPPAPGDPTVEPALRRAGELAKAGERDPALALLDVTLEGCRKRDDAAGEALTLVRRAELLAQWGRKSEAAEAWAAGARAWARARYGPGGVEAWWRSALAQPINAPESQAAVLRAAGVASADRLRPLASAAACRKGARALEAAARPLSARRLYEAALDLYTRLAPESQELARVLMDLGDLLRERNEFEAAASHLLRARDLVERRAPGGKMLADVLNLLSVVRARQGRFTDAEEARVREIAIRRRLEPDSANLANSLLNYGLVFVRKGDDAQAERLLMEALPLQEMRAPGSLGHASTVEALGALAVRRAQWKTAERLYQQSFDMRRALNPESEFLSGSLVNLAAVRIQRGDWVTAGRYLTQALELRQRRQSDSLEVAQIRMAQAGLATAQGDVTAARRSIEQALRIYERRSPNSPPHAGALIELGHLSYLEGDLPAAWKRLAEGVTMLERESGRSSQLAGGLARLARVVAERGDFGVARTHLTRALEIYERLNPHSPLTIKTLTELGRVAQWEGLPAEARAYLERAQKALEQSGQQHESHAWVLVGLAELSLASGRPAEAAQQVSQAVERLRKLKGAREMLAVATHLLAECREAQGETVEAEAAYRQALEGWRQRAGRSPARAQTLYRLAVLLRRTPGRRPEAVRLATEAWEILQQQSAGIAGDESLQAFVRLRAPVAAGVASLLVDAGQSERALQILEENRAQGLRRLLDEQRARPVGVADAVWQGYTGASLARDRAEENVIARANALVQARHDLARAGSSMGAATEVEALKQRVGELEESLEEAERGLAEARDRVQRLWAQVRAPGAGTGPRADFPLSIAHAKQAARAGTAILYYSTGEDRTLLFFISPGTAGAGAPVVQVYPVSIALPALAAEVGGLVGAMRDAQAEAVVRSRKLSERLFPPAVRSALGKAKRVVVVPDGPLWELPFATLVFPGAQLHAAPPGKPRPSPAPPRFLGLERPISIESSLSLFAERERSAPSLSGRASLKVLAMGDPALPVRGPQSGGLASADPPLRSMLPGLLRELGPIPGTRADAQAVASLYGVQPLLAESASEGAIRAALPDADVVHFATHGYLHPSWPRASGLVLSRAATPPADVRPEEDGLLQSWEVYDGLRIRADLVVLAACETGAGAIVRGEGVNSLSRAFRAAGARSVVASLWKVRDDSTRRLMVAFHQRIRKGLAKDEALQQAMKELSARPGMQHPYHWGAFLLVGDRANHLVRPAPAAPRPAGPTRTPAAAAPVAAAPVAAAGKRK